MELLQVTDLHVTRTHVKPSRQVARTPISKVKKGQRSYEVFLSFVAVDSDGKKNGEKILSKECFHSWLHSRKGTIMHPKDSFRRTFLSHLTGNHGRKPFEEEVEASLLRILRKRNENNEPINPWVEVFGDGEKKTQGKKLMNTNRTSRYNKAFGFHEKKKLKGVRAKISTAKNRVTHKRRPEDSVIGPQVLDSGSIVDDCNNLQVVQRTKLQRMQPTVTLCTLLNLSPQDLIHRNSVAQQYNVNIDPIVIAHSYQMLFETDIRLSKQFVFPPPEECHFVPNGPLAHCSFKHLTWEGAWGDETAELFFGDLTKVHALQMYDSYVEFTNTLKFLYPYLELHRKAWFRCRLKHKLGTSTMLVYVERVGDFDYCTAQDQSGIINKRLNICDRKFLV
eukprot:maker-scaffold_1-snap-gene-30.57-mRNA-1 protein AED:0.00 eAED:0.00 QI:232/1/1/1/1/1/3/91/391